jgi:hypothetical protein
MIKESSHTIFCARWWLKKVSATTACPIAIPGEIKKA